MSDPKNNTDRIVNLMQFARKAGKLVSSTEACLRALNRNTLFLMIVTEDAADRTANRIINATKDNGAKVPVLRLGSQTELSQALGLHLTAVYGVGDRQFAGKMMEYYAG